MSSGEAHIAYEFGKWSAMEILENRCMILVDNMTMSNIPVSNNASAMLYLTKNTKSEYRNPVQLF
jgi:hypothetical protein